MASIEEIKIAFVIGNGHSRSVFDVNKLNDHGVTYGCNLLLEDMQLHNTIICDRALLIDMISKGMDLVTNLWTRARWKSSISGGAINELPVPVEQPKTRFDKEIHWGSGTHALHLAANQGADLIAMIGFDIWPRADGKNNIYEDRSDFYEQGKIVDPSHWIHQIDYCFKKFPHTNFVQIQPRSWKDPDSWSTNDNYSRDDYAGLNDLIRG